MQKIQVCNLCKKIQVSKEQYNYLHFYLKHISLLGACSFGWRGSTTSTSVLSPPDTLLSVLFLTKFLGGPWPRSCIAPPVVEMRLGSHQSSTYSLFCVFLFKILSKFWTIILKMNFLWDFGENLLDILQVGQRHHRNYLLQWHYILEKLVIS
jgi:hypothetical protein